MKKILAATTVATMLASALPAFAAGDIVVHNDNMVTVTNSVSSSASSGSNIADGGPARNRTSGGNIDRASDANEAGNGGSTVLGGFGGDIRTGNASATSRVENRLNHNEADIEATPWAVNDIRVRNDNALSNLNSVVAAASSGVNDSNGAQARGATTGGNVTLSGDVNVAGNDGSHVEGGGGGSVNAGNTDSHSELLNVFNRNLVRIRR